MRNGLNTVLLQFYAVTEGSTVHVGGKTNRAKTEFENEFNALMEGVPEVPSDSANLA